MSFSAAQLAIETRFNTNFTSVDIKFDGVDYEATPGVTFAELKIINVDSRRADIGTTNPLHRTDGLIIVNIHTKQNIGTKTGTDLADAAAAIFRDASFSGITCRSPVVRNVGEVEKWYVVNMTCPFYRDEVHT